ncbi:hypothetical protein CRE_28751 [Caenorhabditis remanei]|uniref:protein-ribulosamine 3-kinase n=1 Tax=Caenorhabditis remanei TaxID=31234 RepID=E3MKB7_CAERE|nr:hypothetical protein CRE_28751 [Caenorhabditis remanei]
MSIGMSYMRGLQNNDLVIGELESLRAIYATDTVKCPKPFGVVEYNGSHALVTSYIDFQHGKDWAEAGKQLARMHAKNHENLKHRERRSRLLSFNSEVSDGGSECPDSEESGTEKYGFHVATCCGRLPQENEWSDSWTQFFICHRLKPQIDLLIEKHNDRDLSELSEMLYRKTEELLKSRENTVPSLVHGDLWGGNWSMVCTDSGDTQPIVFDPSSSYSDPEFEFGIMKMFGGWTKEFEQEYDKIMGKCKGRDERVALYELYHNLNHWNHFGGSYRTSSLNLIRTII